MAVALGSEVWAERRRRLGELRTRNGFARQLLDFYGALLGVQEKAFDEAGAASPPPEALASYAAELVFPSVVEVSVAAGPDRLRSEVIRRTQSPTHSEDALEIVRGWIEGADQPAVDRFLARASLGPVLEALGEDARGACAGPRDGRHCPDCGGPPQLSFFERSPDDLATGPRHLMCARCGRTWGYARMRCAACGEDSSAKLTIFSEHGTASGERGSVIRGLAGPNVARSDAVFPHMRIEACDSCRRYLLTVDLATDPGAVPLVDEMSAIPLDLYARERGYTKITTNLMGF
jgi:formate dehydrogenase maturation protein FdhE